MHVGPSEYSLTNQVKSPQVMVNTPVAQQPRTQTTTAAKQISGDMHMTSGLSSAMTQPQTQGTVAFALAQPRRHLQQIVREPPLIVETPPLIINEPIIEHPVFHEVEFRDHYVMGEPR